MKAFQLTGWQKTPELRDVAEPRPGSGEVLLRVTAAGACHSDLHLMDWPAGMLPWKLPFTLGHETVGIVEELGPGVEGIAKGMAYAVYGPWGCGSCRPCRLGRENYCDHAAELGAAGAGLGRNGGMAEYMLVPSARWLVPIGGLDPVQAAPLGDAALTPYHAIKRALPRIEPGAAIVVIGVGGLGHMALQLLNALTAARVIAVDTAEDKLELARTLGAHATLKPSGNAGAALRELTGGRGAALVLDCVGSEATLAFGAQALRAEGQLTVIGLAMGTLPLNFFAVPYGASVSTSYWGTLPELMEVLSLAEAGAIRVHTESFPLDEALATYGRLRSGQISGRAVIVPR